MGSSLYCREDRRQSIYCNPAMRLSMWSPAPSASERSWVTRTWLKLRKRYDERSPGTGETRPAPSILSSSITVLKTRPSPTCREFQRRSDPVYMEVGYGKANLPVSIGLVPACQTIWELPEKHQTLRRLTS